MAKSKTETSFPTLEGFSDKLQKKTLTEFIDTLRHVVDGDEKAREELRNYIEMFDLISKIEGDDWSEDSDDDEDYQEFGEDWQFDIADSHPRELHFRIKLNNIDIKIWREVKVPSNMRLDSFAHVLIDAMGWSGGHLFQFRDGRTYYCTKEMLEDEDDFLWSSEMIDMTDFSVEDIFNEKGKRLKFDYDFGDSWEHDVWLKGEREYGEGEKPVVSCFKGQGECPPDDCGGVWGYMNLIEISRKKKLTKDEREQLEWYGIERNFDPTTFDVDLFGFEEEIDILVQ